MQACDRREFLGTLGRGTLLAGLAPAGLSGLARALSLPDGERLTFGALEPLVAAMQAETPPVLLRRVASGLAAGQPLETFVTAAALANARAFGGRHYEGYHAFMALAPAYDMALEFPASRRALPVLKVLHRNTSLLNGEGPADPSGELPALGAAEFVEGSEMTTDLRSMAGPGRPEGRLARELATGDRTRAFLDLQAVVRDDAEVHRVVLAWRGWDLLRIAGPEHATTFLRQTIHFAWDAEQRMTQQGRLPGAMRKLLAELTERAPARAPEPRPADDAALDEWAATIHLGSREEAARFVAQLLREGRTVNDVGEALSLAANRLLRHDPGREQPGPGKPVGSVHGASVGVHAADSARAWRNIAALAGRAEAEATLIAGAYHTAGQSLYAGPKPFHEYAAAEPLELPDTEGEPTRLESLREAIAAGDQPRACGLVQAYQQAGGETPALLDVLREASLEADGALHAEKFYRTSSEELAAARPAFRSRYLVALARVAASEAPLPDPAVDLAREVLAG